MGSALGSARVGLEEAGPSRGTVTQTLLMSWGLGWFLRGVLSGAGVGPGP